MAERPFFIVWNPARMNSSPRYRHADRRSARAEAERLAHMAPGQSFYVLEAVSRSRKVEVETVDLVSPDPEIPF